MKNNSREKPVPARLLPYSLVPHAPSGPELWIAFDSVRLGHEVARASSPWFMAWKAMLRPRAFTSAANKSRLDAPIGQPPKNNSAGRPALAEPKPGAIRGIAHNTTKTNIR